ncbi:phosphoesterase [Phycomyces blakesleeanus]|uniref:Phosphoesterase n=1 Tax=Phycomyces blakesleeanus TaxID=4837 RepID=A0ABR3B4S7_PHYBL
MVATLAATIPIGEKRESSNIVPGKDYDRIVIVLFENQNYADVSKDPYFSTLAAKHKGVTLTNYKAITHPSQPNYIGMISGSTKGTTLDLNSDIDRDSVVDLLETKGVSWKSYQEGYPGNCDASAVSGTYHRKHNPFISINNIRNNTTRCAKIVPGTQLDIDIANNDVPQFVFYTPDINNDGHDTTLEYSSNWIKGWLEPRFEKPAFNTNTLFVLTWDEQKTYVSLENHVYTVLLGSAVKRASLTDGAPYSHYSVLRSVEDNVSCLYS